MIYIITNISYCYHIALVKHRLSETGLGSVLFNIMSNQLNTEV